MKSNKRNRFNLPIIMHVNYCEQGQTLEELCCKAVKWGFDGVEFRRKREDVIETADEYLETLEKAVHKSGLNHIIFGGPGPDLMLDNPDDRKREIESAIDFYNLAYKRFDFKLCNMFLGNLIDSSVSVSRFDRHGSFMASEQQYIWAVEGMKILSKTAEELGFKFAFETHMFYIHDLPNPAKRIIDMIDSEVVGINLDFANILLFDKSFSMEETFKKFEDKLLYTHLKNYKKTMDGSFIPSPLEDGVINNREFLRLLKKSGFEGPICIEAPRQGDREWFAQQDIKYIKTILNEIK